MKALKGRHHPITCLILLLFFCNNTNAQTDVAGNSLLKKMTPVSPEAASLGRYDAIPVSLYTGIPEISIPLYEIDVNGLKIPIALSYHAGGIKVDDVSSCVGLGWTLMAGGAINRQQKGIADETMVDFYPSYATAVQQMTDISVSQTTKMNIAANWGISANQDHAYDTEPDIFSFSTVNASGKFFHDPQGNVYMMPANNRFQVNHEEKYIVNTSNKYRWARWLLTDNDGIKYVYGRSLDGLRDNLEQTCTYGTGVYCDETSSVNSWFLSDIVLANGQSVKYTYDVSGYTLNATGTYTILLPNSCNAYGGNTGVNSTIQYKRAVRIREITYPGGKVIFVPGETRPDVQGEKTIDKIEVYRATGTGSTLTYILMKAFKFSYSSGSGRIFLASVGEVDVTTGTVVKPYTFTYNTTVLPGRNSFSQDFWGYANGEANTTLLPKIYYDGTGGGVAIAGANRAVADDYTQSGILTKMTYPTGGYAEYTYENNTIVCSKETNETVLCDILNYTSKYPLRTYMVSYQSENLAYNNYTSYSPDFTIPLNTQGRGERGVIFTGHYLPYDNGTCPSYTVNSTATKYQCVQVSLEKKNPNGTYSTVYGDINFNWTFGLDTSAGTTFRLKVYWPNTMRGMFYVDTHYSQEYVSSQLNVARGELFAGGLRIKKIVNTDPVAKTTITRRFEYKYNADDGTTLDGISSGVLMNVPMLKFTQPYCYAGGSFGTAGVYCPAVQGFSSRSMASVFSGDAINVGYKKVTVYTDQDGKNGKTDNYFTTALEYPDGNIESAIIYPYPESRSYEWRRGKPSSVSKYDLSGTSPRVVENTSNTYAFYPTVTNDFKNYTAVRIVPVPLAAAAGDATCGTGYSFVTYSLGTEAAYQAGSTQTYKASDNGTLTQAKTFQQDPQSLQTGTTQSTMSNGTVLTEKVTYSANYTTTASTLSTEAQGIKKLKDYNMLTTPVEKLTIRKTTAGEEFVTSGYLVVYDAAKPLPAKIYTFSNQNIPVASFTNSSINASGTFVKDAHYEERAIFSRYDDLFNLVQQQKSSDVAEIYVWGYNNLYPVAKVLGGDYTTIMGLLNQSILQNPADDKTLRDELNKLRTNYPNQATPILVNTYTYTPMIGLTSETDAAGRTTYYEYDNLGRLKVIKDMNGKILKVIDYQYQQSVTK